MSTSKYVGRFLRVRVDGGTKVGKSGRQPPTVIIVIRDRNDAGPVGSLQFVLQSNFTYRTPYPTNPKAFHLPRISYNPCGLYGEGDEGAGSAWKVPSRVNCQVELR